MSLLYIMNIFCHVAATLVAQGHKKTKSDALK